MLEGRGRFGRRRLGLACGRFFGRGSGRLGQRRRGDGRRNERQHEGQRCQDCSEAARHPRTSVTCQAPACLRHLQSQLARHADPQQRGADRVGLAARAGPGTRLRTRAFGTSALAGCRGGRSARAVGELRRRGFPEDGQRREPDAHRSRRRRRPRRSAARPSSPPVRRGRVSRWTSSRRLLLRRWCRHRRLRRASPPSRRHPLRPWPSRPRLRPRPRTWARRHAGPAHRARSRPPTAQARPPRPGLPLGAAPRRHRRRRARRRRSRRRRSPPWPALRRRRHGRCAPGGGALPQRPDQATLGRPGEPLERPPDRVGDAAQQVTDAPHDMLLDRTQGVADGRACASQRRAHSALIWPGIDLTSSQHLFESP